MSSFFRHRRDGSNTEILGIEQWMPSCVIMTEESDAYRALQRHLDGMPVGFPATESGVEIRILQRLFTPEEARIATYLRYSPVPSETLEEIFERVRSLVKSKDHLEQTLDKMAEKGLILSKKELDCKHYANAQWVVGIYELQVNKMTPELYSDIVDYNIEAFGRELFYSPLPQLRVIPVEKSITPEHDIARYDVVTELVAASEGPFMVANCVCRQAMDLVDNPCKATDRRETCIAFGSMAQMYIEKGWGRELTREELLETIRLNERDGLVLQPSNSQTLEFLCSCCGCCCGILFGAKMSRKPVKFFSTNYYAEVNSDLCTACGTCINLCQMEALRIEEDAAVIDLDRCIGCGVCVANCPSDALTLQKHDEEKIPPQTVEELYSLIREKKSE
ncbi:4Fe-4S dicluster domain-containing protein [Candidatus Thorarchaeota archaeon]|nr:MAG: 4Fe-4S dicluster domain-containing protein [Candidatus Thorarchaeota archaeon]